MTEMGKRIAKLLIDKNMTQRKLAELTGVTEGAMSKYIKGGREPRLMTLCRMAKILGVSMEYLLIGDAAYKEEKHE